MTNQDEVSEALERIKADTQALYLASCEDIVDIEKALEVDMDRLNRMKNALQVMCIHPEEKWEVYLDPYLTDVSTLYTCLVCDKFLRKV